MKFQTTAFLMLSASILMALGCSDTASPIQGGTSGTLTSDGQPMSQMELSIYAATSATEVPIAFGTIRSDGSFELINAERTQAMELPPGDYRVTVETLGAEVAIPKEYRDPSKSPLRVSHVADEPLHVQIDGLSKGM